MEDTEFVRFWMTPLVRTGMQMEAVLDSAFGAERHTGPGGSPGQGEILQRIINTCRRRGPPDNAS